MLSAEGLRFRAAFFSSVRQFFVSKNFLEVDTPLLSPVILPEANIVPVKAGGLFLLTSPELYMKRLLARGHRHLFQICSCFRSEEQGRLHLTEFKMLEWYHLGGDYRRLMEDCRELICYLAAALQQQFPALCQSLDLQRWQTMTVREAFEKYVPVSLDQALAEDNFDQLLVEYIEPNLGLDGPSFLIDYPAQMASLAQLKADDPTAAERFELYINGVEIANGFSELTDTKEQRRRFSAELLQLEWTDTMPERFLDELDLIDEAAGIALGLDRLLMLFMGKNHIDEVQTFASGDI